MIPPLIVQTALELNIDLIAITDHNSSANAAAVMEAARGSSLKVLPGMELLTREEVHLVCLFDTLKQVRQWQAQVDHVMPNLPNRADRFGDQFVVDASGDFVRREERMLLVAANIALENAVASVNVLGGIAIPAHIDRPANGLIAMLGFLPLSLQIDAIEISKNISANDARKKYSIPDNVAVIQSSDAHWLDALGSAITEFEFCDSRNVVELLAALREKRYQIIGN